MSKIAKKSIFQLLPRNARFYLTTNLNHVWTVTKGLYKNICDTAKTYKMYFHVPMPVTEVPWAMTVWFITHLMFQAFHSITVDKLLF